MCTILGNPITVGACLTECRCCIREAEIASVTGRNKRCTSATKASIECVQNVVCEISANHSKSSLSYCVTSVAVMLPLSSTVILYFLLDAEYSMTEFLSPSGTSI